MIETPVGGERTSIRSAASSGREGVCTRTESERERDEGRATEITEEDGGGREKDAAGVW